MCDCSINIPVGSAGERGSYGGYSSTWLFDSTISTTPLSTRLRFNDGDFTLVSEIYVSDTNSKSIDFNAFLDSLLNSGNYGFIRIFKESDSSKFWYGKLNTITDNGTDHTLGVTYILSNGSLADFDSVVLTFSPSGPFTTSVGLTSIPLNAIFVDQVFGNDSTGVPYDMSKPFQDPQAANTHAVAGDTLIIYPGNYTSSIVCKPDVIYDYLPGANTNSAINFIFSTSDSTYTIKGDGNFNSSTTTAYCFGDNLTINFECSNAISTGRTFRVESVNNINLTIKCKGDLSSTNPGTSDGTLRIYTISGNILVEAERIIGDSSLLGIGDDTSPNLKVVIKAKQWLWNLNGGGYTAIGLNGGSANIKLYGNFYLFGNGGFGLATILQNTFFNPVNSDLEIHGNIYAVGNTDGLYSGNNTGGGTPIFNMYGKVYTGGKITNSGCIINFYDNIISTCPIEAISHNSGKTIVHSLVKNLTNNNSAHGIKVSGLGLILKQGVSIVTTNSSVNSVYSTGAQTIKTYPGAVANKVKAGTITELVSNILVSTNVDLE